MLNDIESERSRNRDEGRRSNVRKEMKEKRREEQGRKEEGRTGKKRKEKGRKEGKEGLSFTLTRCTSGSKPFDTAFLNFLINSS